ncbi:MAG: hypothetical protein HC830_14815 [Bacteroidetes bacterium]|nr:hypothetical protein [Bacteroidota bacterium]
MREYVTYLTSAALQGRTQLDQVEIAEQVLHRGKDFNPVYIRGNVPFQGEPIYCTFGRVHS